MAWEQGGGFFRNMGSLLGGIGQGGGGFMGDFGTGQGGLAGMFGKNDLNQPVDSTTKDTSQVTEDTPQTTKDYNSRFIEESTGADTDMYNPQEYPMTHNIHSADDWNNRFIEAETGDESSDGAATYEYEGPWSPEWYDEHGTPQDSLDYEPGPQTKKWHRQNRNHPGNPWEGDYRGFFGKNWDKLGGMSGLMSLLGESKSKGDLLNAAESPEPQDYDPLFGGDGGDSYGDSWADVTGGGAGEVPDATTQGLAGFYNPAIMQMLRQPLPSKKGLGF
jgi:hypothetical protein